MNKKKVFINAFLVGAGQSLGRNIINMVFDFIKKKQIINQKALNDSEKSATTIANTFDDICKKIDEPILFYDNLSGNSFVSTQAKVQDKMESMQED